MGDTLLATSSDARAAHKRALRAELRAWRRGLPLRQRRAAARAMVRQFLRQRRLRRARHVAIYIAYGAELGTAPLLRALQRRGTCLYTPALVTGQARMDFVPLDPQTPLRRDRRGLAQPCARRRRCPARKLDLILLPLLGFDRHGGRLGQGGGYYDRALARRCGRRPLLIGYAYAGQQVESLPLAPWDVRLDAVLTERGLLRCAPRTSTPLDTAARLHPPTQGLPGDPP